MAFLTATAPRKALGRPGWLRAALGGLILLLAAAELPAQAPVSREYQVKAAFLFNFAQFVEWPKAAFAAADAPFRIGVLGDDPFGAALDRLVRGETVHGRRLVVVRSRDAADLQDCQVVFVSRSEKDRLEEILPRLSAHPVLTVGDTAGFAQDGGIINFALVGGRVRFEINPAVAREEGLHLSSQLLSVGKIVKGRGKKETS